MIQLTLNRDYFTSYATLGRITAPNGRGWATIERPWVPTPLAACGKKGESCVPLGTYKLYRYSSDAFPNVWALSAPALDVCVTENEVPFGKRGIARTRCLIHPANFASELRGCVAPGKDRGKDSNGMWMVRYSRDAMNEIRNVLGQSVDIQLIVTSGGLGT